MVVKPDQRFNIFLISFGILAVIILISIILFPFVLKYCCRKRKGSNSADDLENLLEPTDQQVESVVAVHSESKLCSEDTEIDCTVEYRTRGTQLIINLASVTPASNSWRLVSDSSINKLFLLLYINGDGLNSPCQSTKHDFTTTITKKKKKKSILFNEIFIFTIMPYDLSSLNLVIETVLISANWRYNIGTMHFQLSELDQNSYAINRIHQLPFPGDRSLVNECLLSLSIMKCKNSIKLKVVKLYFLDHSSTNQPITGLHVRTQITDFQNPLQIFDTTKKKYQRCVTFNELNIFQFEKPLGQSLELEVQLIESCVESEGETVSVRGRTVLYINTDDKTPDYATATTATNNNTGHLSEVFNNPDMEIIRWHPLPYVQSNR